MPKINSFIFLDFETGGLDPRKHAVTEIAAVAIKGDTLEKIDMVSTTIQPYGDYTYDPEAMKYSGYTIEELQNGLPVKDAVNELINLLKKSDFHTNKGTKPILVAHNSAFDKGFLIQLCTYCNKLKELERYTHGDTDYYGNYQPEMQDSIILSKMVWGADEDMSNFKLDNCVFKAGIELMDAHIGINDTIAMKDMICQFIVKLRSTGTGGAQETKHTFRKHFQF